MAHARSLGRLVVDKGLVAGWPEAPAVIEPILEHLGRNAKALDPADPSRAPPQGDLPI